MSEACRVLRLMLVCHVDFLMGELCLGTLLPLAPLASLPEHRQEPLHGASLNARLPCTVPRHYPLHSGLPVSSVSVLMESRSAFPEGQELFQCVLRARGMPQIHSAAQMFVYNARKPAKAYPVSHQLCWH